MQKALGIGEASRKSGIKIPTIRYYEEIGLLPAPPRTENNRRLFDEDDLRRLRFIRHARELGFEIEPIRELMSLASQPSRRCDDADSIAKVHLADIDRRIVRLSALRAEVARMAACSNDQIADCRVIEVLGDHDRCLNDQH